MRILRGIVVSLLLASSVYLWAGSLAHAGGKVGAPNPLFYNPFEGPTVGEIQFSLPDIEEISLTAAAARAEPSTLKGINKWLDWFKKKFKVILDAPLGLPWLSIADIGLETGKTKLNIMERQNHLISEYADLLRTDRSYTVSEVTKYIYHAGGIKAITEEQIRDDLIEKAGIKNLTEHQLSD